MLLADSVEGYPRVYVDTMLFHHANWPKKPSLAQLVQNPDCYPGLMERCGRLVLRPDTIVFNFWRNRVCISNYSEAEVADAGLCGWQQVAVQIGPAGLGMAYDTLYQETKNATD